MSAATTCTSRVIDAPRETLCRAFAALVAWQVPREMTVTIAFAGIPSSIRPEDNDAGTRSSLGKPAWYVE